MGDELCSITQGDSDGVANRRRTAHRTADGGGGRHHTVDSGDTDRVYGGLRRSRVGADCLRGRGAVAAAIGIATADHRTDRLTRQ